MRLAKSGGVTGVMYPYAGIDSISMQVGGLYSTLGSNLWITFNGIFSNPNLENRSSITFCGQIIKYNSKDECLMLKWLMNQELLGCQVIDSDVEFLFNDKNLNVDIEIRKVKEFINRHRLSFN